MARRSTYYIDVQHSGLGKFRRVTGADKYVVEQKAAEQRRIWDDQWERRAEVDRARVARSAVSAQRAATKAEREANKQEAARRTALAERDLRDFQSVLSHSLSEREAQDWSPLYRRENYAIAPPAQLAPVKNVREPLRSDAEFQPIRDFWSWLLPFVGERREAAMQEAFASAHSSWKSQDNDAKEQFRRALASHQAALTVWQDANRKFEDEREAHNAAIESLRSRYTALDRQAVIDWTANILLRSTYPDAFPKESAIDFIAETGVMIVDYELPAVNDVPDLKAVRYVQARDAFEEVSLKDGDIASIYEDAIYQTCLRALDEIFKSDEIGAIKSLTFNGWVDFVDRSTGKPARSCIVSVQTRPDQFRAINLSAVDPKSCFRALKGVGSSKLAGMASVVPILRLNRDDERFIASHDAIGAVGEETNIAAIPWEEFEFLVRDIFEKEFSTKGSEVKITRASRDRGVDAVAFDSNPIHGGKIVIQAKRYTNTVDVSAVRDLYGTVINEGANRGILVTTSHYGPDAYEFAKDKPLTLLDGGNLLSLLERHGHRARIDLDEAKRLAIDRSAAGR